MRPLQSDRSAQDLGQTRVSIELPHRISLPSFTTAPVFRSLPMCFVRPLTLEAYGRGHRPWLHSPGRMQSEQDLWDALSDCEGQVVLRYFQYSIHHMKLTVDVRMSKLSDVSHTLQGKLQRLCGLNMVKLVKYVFQSTLSCMVPRLSSIRIRDWSSMDQLSALYACRLLASNITCME